MIWFAEIDMLWFAGCTNYFVVKLLVGASWQGEMIWFAVSTTHSVVKLTVDISCLGEKPVSTIYSVVKFVSGYIVTSKDMLSFEVRTIFL